MKIEFTTEEISNMTVENWMKLFSKFRESVKPKFEFTLRPIYGSTTLNFTTDGHSLLCNNVPVITRYLFAIKVMVTEGITVKSPTTGYNSMNGKGLNIGDSCYNFNDVTTFLAKWEKFKAEQRRSKIDSEF